MSSVVV